MPKQFAIVFSIFGCLAPLLTEPQGAGVLHRNEQTEFSMEGVAITRPSDLPSDAVGVLSKTKFVQDCLSEDQSIKKIADWFVASKIHLNGPHEIDLIVMPRELNESPSRNRCLYGANTMGFWVIRQRAGACNLLLDINVHSLRVLDTRTNGYRDIEATSSTLDSRTTLVFKFDGHRYALHKKMVSTL